MFERYVQLLKELVALRSVSAESDQPDLKRTAEWLKRLLESGGFQVSFLTDPQCNPVVVASYDAERPTTTLVYGHYDVQPAELAQGWRSDPFTLTERDGRLYGRGAVDNKGQILIHIMAVLELIERGQLGSNVTFLIEGNEETANPVLGDLIKANRELLAADEIIISDGEQRAGRPTIEASLRGGYNLRLRLTTATNDLHSGLAGGAVPNAAAELTKLLAALTDDRGRVLVDGFYDGMMRVDPATQKTNVELTIQSDLAARLGVKELLLANGVDFYTQTGLYPTLQITGIASGYSGAGFANIVPAAAEARLNVRTVVGQDPAASAERLKRYLIQRTPDYAKLTVEVAAVHDAIKLDTTGPTAARAEQLLGEVYDGSVVRSNVGGAVPVVSDFGSILGIDTLMIPLGNEDCNMHGANENFAIANITKGLEFSTRWFSRD